MKKIIYLILLLFMSFTLVQNVQAQDIQDLRLDRMPSDAEIRNVIDKYDFDAEQKEYLFRETKRKLQYMYNQNATMGQVLGNSQEIMTNPSASAASSKETVDNGKKYAKHAPLTRRSNWFYLKLT